MYISWVDPYPLPDLGNSSDSPFPENLVIFFFQQCHDTAPTYDDAFEGTLPSCLVCEVTGQMIEKVELLKDGQILKTDDRNELTKGVALVNGSYAVKYDVSSQGPQDAGLYVCRATNKDGSVVERQRTMDYIPDPADQPEFRIQTWTEEQVDFIINGYLASIYFIVTVN